MIASSVIVKRLQAMAVDIGSQKALAYKLGISPQYLSDVLAGKTEPGPAILDALGYERILLYREKAK